MKKPIPINKRFQINSSIVPLTLVTFIALQPTLAQVHINSLPSVPTQSGANLPVNTSPHGPIQMGTKLIARAVTTLATKNVFLTYKSESEYLLTAQFTVAGNPTLDSQSNLKVDFYLDGMPVGNAHVDASGLAALKVYKSGLFGPHTFSAKFSGDANLAPAESAKSSLNILPATTKFDQASLMFVKIGTDSSIVAKGMLLRATDGKPLAGRGVDIWLDGASIGKVATDEQGWFSFNQAFGKLPGKHTLQALFDNDTHYVGSATTKAVFDSVADKPPMTLYMGALSMSPSQARYVLGQTVQLQAKVVSVPGPAGALMPGVPDIMVYLAGLPTKTDALGIARMTLRMARTGPDQVHAELSTADIGKNKDGGVPSQPINFNVDPAPIKLTVQGPAIVHPGGTVTLGIKAVNTAYPDDPNVPRTFDIEGFGTHYSGDNFVIPASFGLGPKTLKIVAVSPNEAGIPIYKPAQTGWNFNIVPLDN